MSRPTTSATSATPTLAPTPTLVAGTITTNFDGVRKHRTAIGADSKTGAISVIVAPSTLGEGATIKMGSTLTQDVPAGALSLG